MLDCAGRHESARTTFVDGRSERQVSVDVPLSRGAGMTDVVRPYLVALIAMMSFVLSSGGSSPASDPPRTQCCLPSGCVVKTPNACRQGGGIDVGPGTCSPNPCGGATTTTTSTSTTLPVLCGNGTIEAGEQCDPPGSSCGT